MNWINNQFKTVDNSNLILFRIVFGFLLFAETLGAILTGWVRRVLIEPDFTFTLIGLEWMQPPDGFFMYGYFTVMAVCGILVMLGLYYRPAIILFTIMWAIAYWMQKSSYNNHYYFLILLGAFMAILPANKYASLDVTRQPSLKNLTCPKWCYTIFIIQMWIVYTYASVHKIYPGWMEGEFIAMNFAGKADYPIIGSLLQEDWLQKMIVVGGIVFDGLVVYLMLFRKTRMAAFSIGVIFHLFNSAVFQIGVFPYLMIGLAVFFFEPESIRKRFFKKKPVLENLKLEKVKITPRQGYFAYAIITYFIIQIALPLRNHLYEGNVFYTEEGHRLSWRMMLRYKTGRCSFEVTNPENDSTWVVQPRDFLVAKQARSMAGKPDMIWQFAQYLESQYQKEGFQEIEIRANSRVRLNSGPYHQLIDPEVDLTAVPWEPFRHSDWILSPQD